MKSIVLASALVAAGCLLGTASGHPLKFKRALVTEVVYVTQTVFDAVVYVDESGAAYLTSTVPATSSMAVIVPSVSSEVLKPSAEPLPALTTALSSTSALQLSSLEATIADADETTSQLVTSTAVVTSEGTSSAAIATSEPATSSAVVNPSYAAPTSTQEPAPSPPASSAAPAQSSAEPTKQEGSGRLPMGITYDPFAGSQGSSRCKTADEIASDFSQMMDYKIVRIYGMGCDIIPLAIKNAIKNGQKLMAGAYLSNRGNGEDLSTVIKTLKSAVDGQAGGNWDVIQLFSVENERINDHDMTTSAVVDAINNARGQLRAAGYNGPVGAVDTVPAILDNPAICKASDVVMVNCHAFFDSNSKAQDAGSFVKGQVERVKSTCNTDRVVVAESGWPHQGDANGAAVPSLDNQRMAIESIRNNFNSDMFLFNAFDSTWKSDWASSFNAERYWGIIH